jgi:hypothetical protein
MPETVLNTLFSQSMAEQQCCFARCQVWIHVLSGRACFRPRYVSGWRRIPPCGAFYWALLVWVEPSRCGHWPRLLVFFVVYSLSQPGFDDIHEKSRRFRNVWVSFELTLQMLDRTIRIAWEGVMSRFVPSSLLLTQCNIHASWTANILYSVRESFI